MFIGYARVSTADQRLDLQIDALTKAGCERIFTDHASGGRGDRVGLADALSHLRAGDTLVVWKLDRLGRSVRQLVDLTSQLEARRTHFASLTDGIDGNGCRALLFPCDGRHGGNGTRFGARAYGRRFGGRKGTRKTRRPPFEADCATDRARETPARGSRDQRRGSRPHARRRSVHALSIHRAARRSGPQTLPSSVAEFGIEKRAIGVSRAVWSQDFATWSRMLSSGFEVSDMRHRYRSTKSSFGIQW